MGRSRSISMPVKLSALCGSVVMMLFSEMSLCRILAFSNKDWYIAELGQKFLNGLNLFDRSSGRRDDQGAECAVLVHLYSCAFLTSIFIWWVVLRFVLFSELRRLIRLLDVGLFAARGSLSIDFLFFPKQLLDLILLCLSPLSLR